MTTGFHPVKTTTTDGYIEIQSGRIELTISRKDPVATLHMPGLQWHAPTEHVKAFIDQVVRCLTGQATTTQKHGPFTVYGSAKGDFLVNVIAAASEFRDGGFFFDLHRLYTTVDFEPLLDIAAGINRHGWWENNQEDNSCSL
ncbi:hypothetical protein [Trueperella bialowiezensis]|uniref:Uncharacterized protein n=1 Tax=Trueperella bialowiezensis TaxID=312285 RepID=A0A3S4VT93_9ACTO|nr:hypothetical protein [Trueperella bialowiezensis]VEI13231.1 Uncharacterised protein [Trueperella bialowiezensis]